LIVDGFSPDAGVIGWTTDWLAGKTGLCDTRT
jgi:hypothetical protein